ncbi:dienelactone hydrolase family protein [Qipengyuania sp. 1NDH17]|uniref:Dienelactone hydrolase family protein n=1 Tax=Qipengyuania polymorpha TaxID=2867234 RepID=A0ABS7J4S2_9SPHN|nr:dienelactone hydrolase family protein [Qipengyuania polymorpha]MBX7458423.1 dienelactone hydrolase family protein [Qipengyuania polymorpha]
MCDQEDLARWAKQKLTRRTFGAGTLAGAAAACSPGEPVNSQADGPSTIAHGNVTIATPSGTMDAEFFHSGTGKSPPVLFWPDIAGIRPAKRAMAQRLAEEGYAVLLVNPYYRDVAGEQFADFADFAGNGGWDKVKPWRAKLDAEAIRSDARAVAEWFAGQAAVDQSAGIGTQGYCMGGPFTIWSVAAHDHYHAAASFHGGGLVREGEDSPHRMLREDAHYLIAIAENDDAKEPEAKTALRNAASAAGTTAEIEVYPADHGWCVPDSPAYDKPAAERAWSRLLATYAEALV